MASHTRGTSEALRRAVIGWSVVLVLFVAVFAGTVGFVNRDLYSAPAFVRSYLDALARHDGQAALAIPGVAIPESGSRALLNGVALGELDSVTLLSDEEQDDGSHVVTYAYLADGTPASTEFTIRPTGNRFLFFPSWEFTTSPVATVELQVRHATGFTTNGLQITTDGLAEPRDVDEAAPSGGEYVVLAPSVYSFDHASRYLDADAERVLVDTPGEVVAADVSTRANEAFVTQVQRQLEAYLAGCATQRVLLPSGCPFGQPISDRIEGEPVWSIARMPSVSIQPFSADPNDLTWLAPETAGDAHIVVDVKSLFDGDVSTLDQDVPFTVSYHVTIQPDGSLRLQGI